LINIGTALARRKLEGIKTMASNQLIAEAALGYANPTSAAPYLYSSNSYYAYRIGQWLQQTGRSAPRDVRASRGYTFHVNNMKVQFHDNAQIERIA
jgi:hypothetical protein